MHPRAARLIAELELEPHPEGGHYREIHRSARVLDPRDGRSERSVLTVIYFLLTAGQKSRWHRVASEEVWCFLEGDAIELIDAAPAFEDVTRIALGRFRDNTVPVHVVPAGSWQAARCTGEYALMCCAVAPGFEFADFDLLANLPDAVEALRRAHPDLIELL